MPGWVVKLREAVYDAITETDVKTIVKQIVKEAKEGTPAEKKAARTFLMEYVLGGKMPTKLTQINHYHGRRRKAKEPTAEPAGSRGKVAAMAARHRRGEELFDPEDEERDLR